jgi:hypothetical protein
MKWADIPDSVKLAATLVGGIMFMLGYLTTYQTDAEAQAYQDANAYAISQFRVQEIETQIAAYRFQLLSADLTPEERAWILQEIERLTAKITCIQQGQC